MTDFVVKAKQETMVIISLVDMKTGECSPWSQNFSVNHYLQDGDGWEILKIDHYVTYDERDAAGHVHHWQAVTLGRYDWKNAKRIPEV